MFWAAISKRDGHYTPSSQPCAAERNLEAADLE